MPTPPTIAEVAHPHAAGDEHREHDEREHHRRAEVGLVHHEHGEPARTSTTGRTTRRQSCELARAPADEVGRVEQERELGELARLEAEEAGTEPAARPRHVDPDAGDEHHDEQHHADDRAAADQRRHRR